LNFLLLDSEDFVHEGRVRLRGRRLEHVREILGSAIGDELRVGVLGGKIGRGRVESINEEVMEMSVVLDSEPRAPLPVRLVLALPRPKVLNRTIAAAASMGIREIDLINAWRVEKSYWESPRLSDENLRFQSILGLEQAGDTMLPAIRLHRLFKPFVCGELREIAADRLALLAHPGSVPEGPRHITQPVVLAVGPEGGFIEREVETFREIGFTAVNLGERILRVETALPYWIGRLF
jgi:16S rRNA (uracil1498-N3)-methyltransferase